MPQSQGILAVDTDSLFDVQYNDLTDRPGSSADSGAASMTTLDSETRPVLDSTHGLRILILASH